MTGNIVLNDNVKSIYGTASDGLEIFHDASNSFISDTGTGNLKIQTNGLGIDLTKGSTETLAKFIIDGGNEFYYDGVKKLSTVTTGANVFGNLLTTANVIVGADATFVDNGKALFGNS